MRALVLGICVSAGTPAQAQTSESASASQGVPLPRLEVTDEGVVDKSFPSLDTTFANGVKLLPEVRYWEKEGFRPLTMDIYVPGKSTKTPTAGYPMIMFVHGGGWLRGGSRWSRPIKNFPGLLANIAARGYVVASINYRLSSEARWPAPAQDLKAAIKFLRWRASDYGINPDRFATWGVSAGGHFAAVAATTAGVSTLQPDDPRTEKFSDAVQAAVSWYGEFNMETLTEQSRGDGVFSRDNAHAPEWLIMGCFREQCSPETLRSASPISYVNAGSAPMLLIVGDRDKLIPHQQSIEMAERMKAAGARADLVIMPGVGHDFAGETHDATLEANRQALAITMTFLDGILHAAE